MALPYKKWTDDEIASRNVVDDGEHPFTILTAVQKPTKGGKDKHGNVKPIHQMLELEFEFYDINGQVKKCKDWIVFMDNMDWKLRHLANTTGMLDKYDNDDLFAEDLRNAKGVFTIGTKEMVKDDGTKQKVNFVKDYVKKNSKK